jgi:RNA polymerase sigma-70 factor (ECF subfamily)
MVADGRETPRFTLPSHNERTRDSRGATDGPPAFDAFLMMTRLAFAFASHLDGARAFDLGEAELQATLERLVEASRAAWPDLQIGAEEFVRYLAARVAPDETIRDALQSLHATDLYLACGCAMGDTKAIALLDAHYIAKLSRAPSRPARGTGEGDEVAQRLRVRMLVGDGQKPPRIASYSGRGQLGRWIRIAATRLAADLRRVAPPTIDADGSVDATASDAERSYVIQRYGNEFANALESALRQLTRRARELLRLHFLEEVGVAQIATTQGVSARTIQRRLAATERQIVENLQAIVAKRLALSSAQLDSLLPDVESELVFALRRFFSATGSAPPSPPPALPLAKTSASSPSASGADRGYRQYQRSSAPPPRRAPG